ncbi:MAG TPA: DUF899 family protein [Pseudolabrys sp.]|uniref:DUF899 family protein n=1 Tax=Pseudolabrys sp. TaxID=1960880 RepID=UPI002DDD0CD5|nr:DUF899 family protein [Pseudolabrys sp.]HEV2627954.1 DUF899 family protein [Pseudolabrys sp.]
MSGHTALTPTKTLAENCKVRIPNESAEYRRARTALLAEEIELRRHIERVAEMRRALPPGAPMKDYRFIGENGPVSLEGLFGDKQSLVVYNYMYGPQRERPCPMCTSLLSAWDGEAQDIMQRTVLAVIARSPIERLVAFKKERGWRALKLYSDPSQEFSRDFHAVGENGEDWAGLHVFTRRDGTIRHFWSGEMDFSTADPGQDPRGAPDLMPLWTVLDTTPEGRDPKWYPKLDYGR